MNDMLKPLQGTVCRIYDKSPFERLRPALNLVSLRSTLYGTDGQVCFRDKPATGTAQSVRKMNADQIACGTVNGDEGERRAYSFLDYDCEHNCRLWRR